MFIGIQKNRISKNRMAKNHWSAVFSALVCLTLLVFAPGLGAQTVFDKAGQPISTAPVPAQLLSAKKVFIANDAPAILPSNQATYSGGPDRAYVEFYSLIKAGKHYEIVATPSDADLVLEIRLMNSHEVPDQFRLTIRDPKTNVMLWRLYRQIEMALLAGNRDKKFDLAMPGLITQLTQLAGAPAR
jgi:hypothetical protein